MKGTTKVIKFKNVRAPPESFETECWCPQLPKEVRISRGIVSGGGEEGCDLSATPTRTMCTVVPEAVFTRATIWATF